MSFKYVQICDTNQENTEHVIDSKPDKFICNAEVVSIDPKSKTVTIMPLLSLEGLRVGDICKVELTKHLVIR